MIKPSIMTTLAIASFLPIVIAVGNWTQFPNINIATKEMFHNTERLQPLSSVARGEMVTTPYGWLETYRKQVAKILED